MTFAAVEPVAGVVLLAVWLWLLAVLAWGALGHWWRA